MLCELWTWANIRSHAALASERGVVTSQEQLAEQQIQQAAHNEATRMQSVEKQASKAALEKAVTWQIESVKTAARSVNVAAPDAVKQLAKDRLGDSVRIQPKHALTKEFFELEAGVMPNDGDPSRDEKVSDMSNKVRHALGVTIWLSNFCIDVMRGDGALCSHMALMPLPGALECVRYQTMYLEAHGKGITYCTSAKFRLERYAGIPMGSPYSSRLPNLLVPVLFLLQELDTVLLGPANHSACRA